MIDPAARALIDRILTAAQRDDTRRAARAAYRARRRAQAAKFQASVTAFFAEGR